ncbi:MAG: zinc ribbon domain-containing protein [Steroidobacteraceae bacterium]|jgi:putative FmdB family regulatory protein|nr:zinc ribbon domain-containing protein [Steroidobacteraceae bacterium]
MPTYEYRCKKCRHQFERIESIAEHEKARPQCPKCRSSQVESVLGGFYAKTSKKS